MTLRLRAVSLILLSISLIGTGASAPVSPSAVAAGGGDTCATATLIPSLPFNDLGDTTGATDDIRLAGCAGISLEGPDLVYVFNVFPGNNLTFTVTPLDPSGNSCTPSTCAYDPAIYIRTACPQGTGSCVARADAGFGGEAETMTVSGLAPGAYYFYVDSVYPPGDPAGGGPYALSVTGTLGTPNNTSFYTLPPCRILDTRHPVGPWGGPALVAGATRVFTIAGQCNVPSTAKSVSVNVTVTQPTADLGFLILFPGGTPPTASTINFRAGQTRANNAIEPLSATGTLSVTNGPGTTDFILDVNGYFQ